MQSYTRKITITIPAELLEQLDRPVRHELSTRSGVIRQAVWDYAHKPQNEVIANPDRLPIDHMFKAVEDDYPGLDPNNAALIKFFYEQKVRGQTEE
ncbi:MAG TPA: ribbon-helix-helix domain-containing protein [Candidatus Saccharimonadales bacterium]|nr:ribbon-helix-helix domain-containing protein [Candidatus Saccharimonadales bacterium]